jgi:hypothetical protein
MGLPNESHSVNEGNNLFSSEGEFHNPNFGLPPSPWKGKEMF